MDTKFFTKNVILVCLVVLLIILFVYVTYSLREGINARNILTDVLMLDEDIYGNTEFDSSNIVFRPIIDSKFNNGNNNVIHIEFNVMGNKDNTNKDNAIYDIALVDLELDCNLLSPYLKWKLIKNKKEEFNGSLDYKFDTIKDGRLVLTNIQQDLIPYNEDKSLYDHYDFYLWISDSCQEDDISLCVDKDKQNNLMNKSIKGKIEVELYGGNKKELIREPSAELNTNTCINE